MPRDALLMMATLLFIVLMHYSSAGNGPMGDQHGLRFLSSRKLPPFLFKLFEKIK